MPETVSTHFACPHCKKVIPKPEQYILFANARGVGTAGSATDTCPYCREDINRLSIINGEYDVRQANDTWGCVITGAIALVVFIVLARACE